MSEPEHPKKHRRRLWEKLPIPARLIFDDDLRGPTGYISHDLWTRLDHSDGQDTIYAAVSPLAALAGLVDEISWRVICLKKSPQIDGDGTTGDRSWIRLPSASHCARSILALTEASGLHRHIHQDDIEVSVVSAQPLVLDSVFISIEKDLLKNVDAAQKTFGGGFDGTKDKSVKSKTRKGLERKSSSPRYWETSGSSEDRLRTIVQKAFAEPLLVHESDTISLPVPSHPITHLAPPPAIVEACLPVKQGIVGASTSIVLRPGAKAEKPALDGLPIERSQGAIGAQDESLGEGFYTADESQTPENTARGSVDQSESESASLLDSDSVSDSSLDDFLSVQPPDLPPLRSGFAELSMNATPRPGSWSQTGSLSPGSVLSNNTSTTLRNSSNSGKVCQVEPLLKHIPFSILHPKPDLNDDGSAFIFVDAGALAKIGCFSGSWVRVEKGNQPLQTGFLDPDSPQSLNSDPSQWRTVRIFGISGLHRYRHSGYNQMGKTAKSRSKSYAPTVYVPPVLLYNIGSPSHLKISALPRLLRVASMINPPLAKEIALRKIATPESTKKGLQASMIDLLKRHFQGCLRAVRSGDLIPVALDEQLGQVISGGSQTVDSGEHAYGSQLAAQSKTLKKTLAWYVVERLVTDKPSDTNGQLSDHWGGVQLIDSSTIRMAQGVNITHNIPDSLIQQTIAWLKSNTVPDSLGNSLTGFLSRQRSCEPYLSPLQRRLKDFIKAGASPRALSLGLLPLAFLLHSTQRRIGKSYIAQTASSAAGMHPFVMSAFDVLADAGASQGGDEKAESSLKVRLARAWSCGKDFTVPILTQLELLTAGRMVSALEEIIHESRVFIATTSALDKIPEGMRSLFTHEMEVAAPNEKERESIFHSLCMEQSIRLDPSVSFGALALKTAALVAGDLVDVAHRASLVRDRRLDELAEKQNVDLVDVELSGGSAILNILPSDFDAAISLARSTFSDSIGAPKIPTVTWDDVGGLVDQKAAIMETISLPLSHPELFAQGMRKRSGILFYGPPGTGKTLLAKAIATEFSLNFFSVKGPELLNMYIGESEANVRRVFQKARDARPCVVFFDELDSVAPKRGNQGDSGGVMDRIVSQLLAELDGMSSSTKDQGDGDATGGGGGVFVIGATNRPDLLDPALLRPGRFDKMLYLGVSSTHDQQLTILKALTRKFSLAPDLDLSRVVSRLPLTYTGADLYALCSDAMLKAITRKTKMIDVKVEALSKAKNQNISTGHYFDHHAVPEDTVVVVSEVDFIAAQDELVASVSLTELAHFNQIRAHFEQQDLSHKPPKPPSTPPRRISSIFSSVDPRTTSKAKPAHFYGKGSLVANPDSGPDDSGSDSDRDGYATPYKSAGEMNGYGRGHGSPVGMEKGKEKM